LSFDEQTYAIYKLKPGRRPHSGVGQSQFSSTIGDRTTRSLNQDNIEVEDIERFPNEMVRLLLYQGYANDPFIRIGGTTRRKVHFAMFRFFNNHLGFLRPVGDRMCECE